MWPQRNDRAVWSLNSLSLPRPPPAPPFPLFLTLDCLFFSGHGSNGRRSGRVVPTTATGSGATPQHTSSETEGERDAQRDRQRDRDSAVCKYSADEHSRYRVVMSLHVCSRERHKVNVPARVIDHLLSKIASLLRERDRKCACVRVCDRERERESCNAVLWSSYCAIVGSSSYTALKTSIARWARSDHQ